MPKHVSYKLAPCCRYCENFTCTLHEDMYCNLHKFGMKSHNYICDQFSQAKTIKEIINHLSKGCTVITMNSHFLEMGEDGTIRDQDNNIWDIARTNPNDYKIEQGII